MKYKIVGRGGDAMDFLLLQAEIDGNLDDPWPTLEKLLLIAKSSLLLGNELSDRHLDDGA
jgi:hypothetical protein